MMKQWWSYQQEHFPILPHAGLTAVFAFSAVGYSCWLRQEELSQGQAAPLYPFGLATVAFISLFLFNLQHSILQNLRSVQRDWNDQYDRSTTPVKPSNLSLIDLKILGVATAVIQLGLAVSINAFLVLLLLLIWSYMAAQSQDFFVSGWLRTKPLLELISEALLLPLLALYATAFDWLVLGVLPHIEIFLFLWISFCSGLLMKVSSKICAPKDEKLGGETYTMMWGRKRAVILWLSSVWLIVIASMLAVAQARFLVPALLLFLFLLTLSVTIAWRFLAHPITKWTDGLKFMSTVWTLTVYLTVGIAPWFV